MNLAYWHTGLTHKPECKQGLTKKGEKKSGQNISTGENKQRGKEENGNISYICIFINLQLSVSKVLSSGYLVQFI